jgi:DNA adenine methylase
MRCSVCNIEGHTKRKCPTEENTTEQNKVKQKMVKTVKKNIQEKLETEKEYIKPFLKWVGGKTQIIDKLMNEFPKEMNNYHEPFLGGGSVLLALLCSKRNGTIKINGSINVSDINANTIHLFKNIKLFPEEIINQVHNIINEFNTITEDNDVNRKPTTKDDALTSKESYYFWIRKQFNELSQSDKLSVKGSSLLLFLNKTCFRGVYREGPNGFNVPYGNYKNPTIINDEHIRDISDLIRDVNFSVKSFEDSLKEANENDFIYLDPPYAPENDKSFVGYVADGFNLKMHEKLFGACKDVHNRNVKLLMSNSDVKLIRDNFTESHFKIETINCRRAINSKNPEATTNEVLIKNY